MVSQDQRVTRRGLFRTATVSLGGMALLAACGAPTVAPAAKPEAAPKPGEPAPAKTAAPIKIVAFLKIRPAERVPDFAKEIIQPYQQLRPNVQVEHIDQPDATADAVAKVKTMQAGGVPPDVTEYPRIAFSQVMDDIAQPITDLVKKANIDLKVFAQALFEGTAMFQGEIYHLPMGHGGNALTIMINPKFFNEAGLSLPSADPKDTWTWEQWVEVMVKLRKMSGDQVTQWALGNHAWQIGTWPLLWKTDWIAQDFKTIICDNPDMLDCYTKFFELVHKHRVLPPVADRPKYFGDKDPFLTGQVPLHINAPLSVVGTYAVQARQQGVDFTMAPMPRVKHSTPDVNWHMLSVVPGSKVREAAFDFVVYLSEQGRFAKFVRRIPAWGPEIKPFIAASFKDYSNPRIEAIEKALASAVPQTNLANNPGSSRLFPAIDGAINERLWTGKSDAPTVLKELKPTLQGIADEGYKVIEEKLKGRMK